MSKAQTLARLQALLDRVRSRSGEPRRAATAPSALPSSVSAATPFVSPGSVLGVTPLARPAVSADTPLAPSAAPNVLTGAMAAAAVGEAIGPTGWTPAPRADHASDAPSDPDHESLVDVDIEVDVEITDLPPAVDGAFDEGTAGGSSESAERLVAAQAEREPEPVGGESTPESLTDPSRRDGRDAGDSARPRGREPVARTTSGFESESPTRADSRADIHVPVEPAPASSRRPVALERVEPHLGDLAFAGDVREGPRHTPPPESGRLPAPAAAGFEEDTGIRDAIVAPPSTRAGGQLVPQATKVSLHPSETVMDLIAEAQAFAPGTFLEWLDATLAL